MYTFKEISESEIDSFNIACPYGSVFQLSGWAKTKNCDDVLRVAAFDDKGTMAAATQILLQRIPYVKKYIGKIPYGIMMDFNNQELVVEVGSYLQDLCKDKGIAAMEIDFESLIKNSVVEKESNAYRNALIMFEKNGFTELKKPARIGIKPNTCVRIPIKQSMLESVDAKILYADEIGIVIETYTSGNITKEIAITFMSMIESQTYQDIKINDAAECYNMIKDESLGLKLYMAKCDLNKVVEYKQRKIKQLMNQYGQMENELDKMESTIERTTESEEKNEEMQIQRMVSIGNKRLELGGLNREISELSKELQELQNMDKENAYLSAALCTRHNGVVRQICGKTIYPKRLNLPEFYVQNAIIGDAICASCNELILDVPENLLKDDSSNEFEKLCSFLDGEMFEGINPHRLVADKAVYLFSRIFNKKKEVQSA